MERASPTKSGTVSARPCEIYRTAAPVAYDRQELLRNAEPFEVVQDVRFNAFKLRFYSFQILCFYGKREILCFDESVIPF